MSYTNCLPVDSYEGTINGIQLRWHYSARERLNTNAGRMGADPQKLKAVTERLAYACALRLERTGISILYDRYVVHYISVFHLCELTLHLFTSTTIYNGETIKDEPHITLILRPGQWKAYIYVNVLTGELDNVTMKGESVLRNGVLDATLSTGTYPSLS
ncbi:hypothetical protein McanMca71_003407 [Microsporum canis]|uniref:Uncharacterized protein n=1 Tax=Arthroderma otae (strain ATCC MYA-4605 / CBS 113480) TaxID=554155 RepID=C5FS71_ARTOC|nr:uncharacterized protein MCYG_05543 [Microsporum canis CBS 113480]EEQ32724.1 predicted protein [Microsporum canis CBS 113480]